MIIKPKHLKINSTTGLAASSGIIREEKFNKAVSNMKDIGLKVFNTKFEKRNYGYLADEDIKRKNELENFFKNKSIESIFAIRGGYGATRILDKINYKIIKKNPKVFVGFSDITALHSAIWQKTSMVTFHGIVASSNFTDYTKYQLDKLIFNPAENYTIPIKSIKILNDGIARGRIVGGNLSLLVSLIGTEYLFDFDNKIVFIEDVGEAPYKIDKMLNHLLMATNLPKASAIVFGKFSKCKAEDHNTLPEESFTVEQIIEQYFAKMNIPIAYDVNFGHIDDSIIIPIGIKAEINTEKSKIQLLEKPVI